MHAIIMEDCKQQSVLFSNSTRQLLTFGSQLTCDINRAAPARRKIGLIAVKP